MNSLVTKSKEDSSWDFASLGEILLRFCPGDGRIRTARSFEVYDGGGEYNVARNLAWCFGQRAGVLSALADNALGRLAENLVRAGGVDASRIVWREADESRNGIYFIERGFGQRAAASAFDRQNTAISALKPSEIDWQSVFASTRWFHTGGVFAGLSDSTPDVAQAAMQAARAAGAVVSYDLNYRDSLWRKKGGREAANRLNRELLKSADVVFGVFDFDARLSVYDEAAFRRAAEKMTADFPNLKLVASTLRDVRSATRHDLSGVVFYDGAVAKAQNFENCEIYDRVGSGDAFASGVAYGFLAGESAHYAAECGAASGVLAMTTAGDNLQVTRAEVENLMRGAGAVVNR